LEPYLIQRQYHLKLFNILTVLSLLYVCQILTLKLRVSRMKTSEMKFMSNTAGCI